MTNERLQLGPGQLAEISTVLQAGLDDTEIGNATPEFATALVLWKRLRARLGSAVDPWTLPDMKP